MSEPIDLDVDVERAVRQRYTEAAHQPAPALCCPVTYDARLLENLPREIVERDYGCGDPARHLRVGETVLDLGSGAGKVCYIAAQVVGPRGRVIGVDANDEMLALARRHVRAFGERVGYHNVAFRKGRIQDLRHDPEALERRLAERPVGTPAGLEALAAWTSQQRAERPLIPSESVDDVISNCVLNLVRNEDKQELFREMHRVLRRGGRAVISDIVSDEVVPARLAGDPELWSGCISGAFREDRFLQAFEAAGFYGMRILARGAEPWRVVEGIEFRSLTVEAFRGKEGPCLERHLAVIYKGPWRSVTDDDGHTLHRGQRMAVCDKIHRRFSAEPYAGEIVLVPAYREVTIDAAESFDCSRDPVRSAEETEGSDARAPRRDGGCGPDGCC